MALLRTKPAPADTPADPAPPKVGPAWVPALAELMGPRGSWLIGRLAARFPVRTEAEWLAWLRAAISGNGYHLVVTEKGAALGAWLRSDMARAPYAKVLFLLLDDPRENRTHANRLFKAIESWAHGFGALWVELPADASDCQLGDLKIAVSAETRQLIVRFLTPERI